MPAAVFVHVMGHGETFENCLSNSVFHNVALGPLGPVGLLVKDDHSQCEISILAQLLIVGGSKDPLGSCGTPGAGPRGPRLRGSWKRAQRSGEHSHYLILSPIVPKYVWFRHQICVVSGACFMLGERD